jgi:RNA polymerase sigma-70 factor, ECF subfamily
MAVDLQRAEEGGAIDVSEWGGSRELDALFHDCYLTLRRIARGHLRNERQHHTLSSGGLVHEVYLKLKNLADQQWDSPTAMLAASSQAMRQVLIDSARRKRAAKRQADPALADSMTAQQAEHLIALDDVLRRLSELDDQAGKMAEMRGYGGLSLEEAAAALGLSYATARRRWDFAKAWLRRELAR